MTEHEYRDEIYAAAEKVKTEADFHALLEKIASHAHDYGTIIYACSAAMQAAFRIVDNMPCGGITGFQAGCLMWEMVKKLGMFSDGPLKIVDYGNLLYPQYDGKFEHTISQESAAALSEQAKKRLDTAGVADGPVVDRWREIARGEFPSFITIKAE